jgi:hypothetical protein
VELTVDQQDELRDGEKPGRVGRGGGGASADRVVAYGGSAEEEVAGAGEGVAD